MFATMNSGKVLLTLICIVFSCFSLTLISCGTDSETLRAERAEKLAAKLERELENTQAELERLKEELNPSTPERLKDTPERLRERIRELEELVEKLPQANIENVRIDQRKKDMDIYVKFNIKNRKDIECFVEGDLFQRRKEGEKFEKLEDKKGKPISISEKFTPKDVEETQTVKLSISYAELNVTQRRELKFDFHIYDKPTDSFLNTEPYSKLFRFDP